MGSTSSTSFTFADWTLDLLACNNEAWRPEPSCRCEIRIQSPFLKKHNWRGRGFRIYLWIQRSFPCVQVTRSKFCLKTNKQCWIKEFARIFQIRKRLRKNLYFTRKNTTALQINNSYLAVGNCIIQSKEQNPNKKAQKSKLQIITFLKGVMPSNRNKFGRGWQRLTESSAELLPALSEVAWCLRNIELLIYTLREKKFKFINYVTQLQKRGKKPLYQ